MVLISSSPSLVNSSYFTKKCNDVNEMIGSNPPPKNANHLFCETTSLISDPNISQTGEVSSTQDLNKSPLTSISLNEKKILPIICIKVTNPNINHTPPLILFVAATNAVIAPTSIAIDRYMAQLIGFVKSYQDTT